MKILIVEDDNDLREITTHSLEKERYVVSQAPDYRTALQKIEDYDYDCILLDIMLPDGNGLDLLAELHALGKHTNVIILSAKDSLEDKVNGLVKREGDLYTFQVTHSLSNAGSFKVAYRMFPKHPELPYRQDFCYVRWFNE